MGEKVDKERVSHCVFSLMEKATSCALDLLG